MTTGTIDQQTAARDEERERLDAAVKPRDGFFTTFFVSPYSKYIARWAARRGVTPNQVTVLSLAIGIVAAAAFATGERWGLIAGAVLLQVAFTADCVDGQLARYTGNFSALGGWLDAVCDRTKEYAVYAGLAIGGADVWVLACAALILQTFRHLSDFSFTGNAEETAGENGSPLAGRVVEGWAAGNRLPVMAWVRRVIAFPIGERFAAISLTAAVWSPRTTFIVLLVWGGVAAVYTSAGRVLRTLARHRSFTWTADPLLRVVEYAVLVWVATLAGDSSEPAAFALLAVLAFHHYDVYYRPRHQGRSVPRWIRVVGLGWSVGLAWILYAVDALPAGFYALAGVLGVVFVAEAAGSWRRPA
jgi:phosphatidylglycerophosphate synthase